MKNHETRLRTPAAVTGLTAAEERAAARQTLRLLKSLQNALKKGLADGDDVHWVDDLAQLTPEAALFLFQTLGRGEVTLHLYGGEARADETGLPGVWKLKIGPQTSLVAGRIPRCVIAAVSAGDSNITIPKKWPAGLTAAPALLTELKEALYRADLSVVPESAVPQWDLLHQPLSPADMNFLLAALGSGKTTAEISGFAKTRIDSTRVKGLWRTRVFNNQGKPLLDALSVTLIPPEIPAGIDDWPETLKALSSLIGWLQSDLATGRLGGAP